jgi:hypothetical protein
VFDCCIREPRGLDARDTTVGHTAEQGVVHLHDAQFSFSIESKRWDMKIIENPKLNPRSPPRQQFLDH